MAVASSYEPNNTYDLPSEVEAGKNVEKSHGNMQFKTRIGNLIVPYKSFICKYYHALSDYIIEYEFTDEEYHRYYQSPKLLSTDLYGTPELWSWILYINNCRSVANFTERKVKVFSNNIDTAITELFTMLNDDIKDNKAEVYTEN
jgi:hypothetical protein